MQSSNNIPNAWLKGWIYFCVRINLISSLHTALLNILRGLYLYVRMLVMVCCRAFFCSCLLIFYIQSFSVLSAHHSLFIGLGNDLRISFCIIKSVLPIPSFYITNKCHSLFIVYVIDIPLFKKNMSYVAVDVFQLKLSVYGIYSGSCTISWNNYVNLIDDSVFFMHLWKWQLKRLRFT